MKKIHLITAACGTLLAATAHAQYAAPQPTSRAASWEVDAGVGYVFNTSESVLDNGANLHVGGYKLQPGNGTRELMTKFGGELYVSSIDGTGNSQLDTTFLSADIGVSYAVSKSIELGITGGVGAGRLEYEVGRWSDDTMCVGVQIRPEVIFRVNDKVGVSLAYRFLETIPFDNNWDNMNQHALELSVRVAF